MKIDFTKLQVVRNCEGDTENIDISKTVGNWLYQNATTIEADDLAHAIHRGENPDIPDELVPLLQQMRFTLWPVEKAWRAVIGEPAKPEKK